MKPRSTLNLPDTGRRVFIEYFIPNLSNKQNGGALSTAVLLMMLVLSTLHLKNITRKKILKKYFDSTYPIVVS